MKIIYADKESEVKPTGNEPKGTLIEFNNKAIALVVEPSYSVREGKPAKLVFLTHPNSACLFNTANDYGGEYGTGKYKVIAKPDEWDIVINKREK